MLKRAFDIFASALGLLVLSPLFMLIALIIYTISAGPVLYRTRRVGRGGLEFTLYKFRTMVRGADQQGPGITTAGDPRVTPIGRFLRRTKIDELPQLINVLKGDMSLVGPRPEDPRYVALYTPEQRQVLNVRPGITSKASVEFRKEEDLLCGPDWERAYIERILPTKLAIDLDYVKRASLREDIAIIFRTLWAIVR